MDDRRRLKRRHLLYYSRVFDRRTGMLLGYLANLTHEGVMIISAEPVRPGVVYALSVDLPEGTFAKENLKLQAQSMWCSTDVDPNFYAAGFQLMNTPEEDSAIIDQIVQDYGFHD